MLEWGWVKIDILFLWNWVGMLAYNQSNEVGLKSALPSDETGLALSIAVKQSELGRKFNFILHYFRSKWIMCILDSNTCLKQIMTNIDIPDIRV